MVIDRAKARWYLPQDREVQDVIEQFCQICELDSEKLRVEYIGGNRRSKMSTRGVKLIRPVNHAVQVYIGCANETVEANLRLINGNRRAVEGTELFAKIQQKCGRLFRVDGQYTQEDQQTKNDQSKSDNNCETQAGTQVSGQQDDSASTPNETPAPSADDSQQKGSNNMEQDENRGSRPSVEGNQEIVFKHYLDNPAKLHLLITALTAQCGESLTFPFTHGTLCAAINDAGIPNSAGIPISILRTLLTQGFVVKINPGVKPGRYNITDKAVNFARNPSPSPQEYTNKTARPRRHHKEQKPIVLEQTVDNLKEIKSVCDEHRMHVATLEEARKKLVAFQELNIESDTEKTLGEIRSLETRLETLRQYKAELDKKKIEKSKTAESISALEEKIASPRYVSALTQLEQIRKLLELS